MTPRDSVHLSCTISKMYIPYELNKAVRLSIFLLVEMEVCCLQYSLLHVNWDKEQIQTRRQIQILRIAGINPACKRTNRCSAADAEERCCFSALAQHELSWTRVSAQWREAVGEAKGDQWGRGIEERRRLGITYVLHSPLQNSEYLCIQGLESLRTWRIWKQQFTARLSHVKSSSHIPHLHPEAPNNPQKLH